MKKIVNKFLNYKFSKFQYLLLLLIPFLAFYTQTLKLDSDTWYILNTGKYIFNNGISNSLIFTIHNGFDMVMQNWGSCLIFYMIYKYFNYFGIMIFVSVILLLMSYLYYKITYLVSEKKVELSVIISICTMVILIKPFIVARTQIFTFLLMLVLIYSLEMYIKKNNSKYLISLPIISLLEINIHAAFWFMPFIIILPYLLDSFKFKIGSFKGEGYRKKPLIIAIIIMFLVGFINPYGMKAMFILFTSISKDMGTIYELKSINLHDITQIILLIIILLSYILYFIVDKSKIKIRYILLTVGTSLLTFYSVRMFPFFVLCTFFSFGYVFKDNFNNFKDKLLDYSKKKKILHYLVSIIFILIITIIIFKNIQCNFTNPLKKEIDYLTNNYNKESITLYTSFDDGGFVEYSGINCYIDSRAEVFLKSNNHKFDVFNEFNNLQNSRNFNYKNFFKKYNFTHLLINKNDILNIVLKENDYNYKLVKQSNNYKIYVRKNFK